MMNPFADPLLSTPAAAISAHDNETGHSTTTVTPTPSDDSDNSRNNTFSNAPVLVIRPFDNSINSTDGVQRERKMSNPHMPFRDQMSTLSTQTSVASYNNNSGGVDFMPMSDFDGNNNAFDGTAGIRPGVGSGSPTPAGAGTTQQIGKGRGFFLSRRQALIAGIIIAALLIIILGLAIGLGARGKSSTPPSTTSPVAMPLVIAAGGTTTITPASNGGDDTTTEKSEEKNQNREARILINNNDELPSPATTSTTTTTTTTTTGSSAAGAILPTNLDSDPDSSTDSSAGGSSTTTESLEAALDRLLAAPIWNTTADENSTSSSAPLEAYVNGKVYGETTTTRSTTTDAPVPIDLFDNSSIRLPLTFIPKHYNVELRPLLDPEFKFSGLVEIDMISSLNASLMTDKLVLHAKDILIEQSNIVFKIIPDEMHDATTPAREIKVLNSSFDLDREFLIIQLGEQVVPDTAYRVALNFSGLLDKDLVGIYVSSYNVTEADGSNSTHWLMASQMEPVDARRVFPMFDEPGLKATFNVTIIHDKKLTALCNMPQLQPPEPHPTLPDMVIDRFVPTPPMSTYLLAFVLTDFPHIEQTSTNGTLVRLWARPDILNSSRFALDLSVRLLDYFENYYQIPYPLKILDQVAVPDMYTVGMENWGLIQYQEQALIYDANVNSASHRKTVLGTVAHEIAHQWFGNLVSPAWWDDLWLNEGFADYAQYVGGNRMRPQWRYMNDFLTSEIQDSMRKDALRTTHPIRVQVYKPSEIAELFDEITYGKGASILRMLRHFLGESIFSRGINAYLRQFAYGIATQDDFWDQLTKTAHDSGLTTVDVKHVMNSWTLKPGMPVVHLFRRNSSSGEQVIQVAQERFLLLDNATISNSSNTPEMWHIPLTIMPQTFGEPLQDMSSLYNYSSYSLAGHEQTVWIRESSVTLTKANAPNSIPPTMKHWFLANILQSGYFRVNYDHSNWHLLLGQLVRSPTVIHVANRAQLIDDAFNLARAGYLSSYDIPLGMVRSYLPDENDYLPWQAALNNLEHLDFMMRTTPDYDAFRDLMMRTLLPVTTRLDLWNVTMSAQTALQADNDTAPVIPDLALIKMRTLIYQAACYFDVPECVTHATKLFNAWMVQYDGSKQTNANLSAANPIPVDFKRTIYATGVRLGGVAEWDFGWEQYVQATNPRERQVLLRALAATREPWLLRRYLRMAVDEQQIKQSDVMDVFASVAMSSETGRELAWDMFVDEWPSLRNRFAMQPFGLSSAIEGMLTGANTLEAFKQVKAFLEEKREELGTARKPLEQGLEVLQANVDWMRDSKDKITWWLQIASAFSQAASAFIAIKASNAP